MQGGFSFCGRDIADFGLEYVPTLDQTYVFAGSEYEVHQEVFDAHHGGYFYGTTVQPKVFTLKCFYQDQHINQGTLDAVASFFTRGKTGKLVFQNRDWVWYSATVTGLDLGDLRNFKNGFVTITLTAYYPFARCDTLWLPNGYQFFDGSPENNSGLLPEENTPPHSFDSVTENMNFYLYNGGTEKAPVAIAIAGNAGEGITITNHTTGQTARFVGFSKDTTTNAGKYIVSDALNGRTVLTDGTNSTLSYLYHDYGFIELAPSHPVFRDLTISINDNLNSANILDDSFVDDVVGKHVFLNGSWRKIVSQSDKYIYFFEPAAEAVVQNANSSIVSLNEISVELGVGAELTKLAFIYKPTFR